METAEDDEHESFRNGIFGSGGHFGLQSTLRALSGMMSGMSSRLRDILSNLKTKEDPSVQLIALQELSDLLLVSNEDNLAGHFSPDPYVHELVNLMQPNDFGEENPEIMLLACRCLANMMEAIRGSAGSVVQGGAVPILCQKLLDIQFIDLAEQALSVCPISKLPSYLYIQTSGTDAFWHTRLWQRYLWTSLLQLCGKEVSQPVSHILIFSPPAHNVPPSQRLRIAAVTYRRTRFLLSKMSCPYY